MTKKQVVIVDDEKKYRDGLAKFLSRDADVKTFHDPDAFAESFPEKGDLDNVFVVVLDYKFDTYSAHDKDLVAFIRDDLKFAGTIVLWSL